MSVIHAVADYQFVLRRVIRWLGIADPNYPEGTNIATTAPYTITMIRQQIIQSDLEVAALIAGTEDHPFKNDYFTAPADTFTDGAKITGYIGVHGKVTVLVLDTVKDLEIEYPAELASSYEHLLRVKRKFLSDPTSIPETSKRLYWIENGRIFLVAATSVTIELPRLTFNLASSPPTLLTPQVMANAVIGHAIFTSLPVGSDESHREKWQRIWAGYAQIIAGGGYSLPEPERMQRIAT